MFPKIVGFPPKSSISIGFSIIDHPFWGIPDFWKHPCTPCIIPENLSNSWCFLHHLFTSQIWPFWPSIRWTWLMVILSPPFFNQTSTMKPKDFQSSFLVKNGSSRKFLRVYTWLPNRLTTCQCICRPSFGRKPSEFPFMGKVEIHREWHVSPSLQCSCSLPSTSGRNDTKLRNPDEVLCGEKELWVVKFSWGNPQPANPFWYKANHSS